MFRKVVVWLLLVCLIQRASPKTTARTKKEILDQILPKDESDVLIAPANKTVVEVSMYILDFALGNDDGTEATITFYIRQTWKDNRLKYPNSGLFKFIGINSDDVIWTPDVFFSNQKKGYDFNIVRPNVFVKIFPDGTVFWSKKISVTTVCPVDFKRFPFDKQECSFHIESYGSNVDDIVLKWRNQSAVEISSSIQIPLFQLEKLVSASGITQFSTGEYSFLGVHLYTSRSLTHYVYQIYLPSVVLVVLSWLPFWMKKRMLIGRLLLCVGLLLTFITTINYSMRKPKSSQITSIQLFIAMCFAFLTTSLIETVLVHILSKDDDKIKECSESGDVMIVPRRTHILDLGSRLVVPAAYVLICTVYFATAGALADNAIPIPGNKTDEIILNKCLM
ncbi:hypothetical protein FQA39_LY16646 [Lamprigera yunnana]|nr:hypothetical protein FQA39_LY16646 [Lamprigera yunnana]